MNVNWYHSEPVIATGHLTGTFCYVQVSYDGESWRFVAVIRSAPYKQYITGRGFETKDAAMREGEVAVKRLHKEVSR